MFVAHQIIVLWVVVVSVGILAASSLNLLRLFGCGNVNRAYAWIVYGAPYFPAYIALGLLLGWLLGRTLSDQSMWWVWVLPTLALGYALIATPTLTPHLVPSAFQAGVGQSRFEHYFGRGCLSGNYCLDQNSFTRPFYDSMAYSVGSFIAFTRWKRSRASSIGHVCTLLTVGVLFVLAAVCDFFMSLHVGGWHWQYLPLEGTVAAMGLYLLLLARVHRDSSPQSPMPALAPKPR